MTSWVSDDLPDLEFGAVTTLAVLAGNSCSSDRLLRLLGDLEKQRVPATLAAIRACTPEVSHVPAEPSAAISATAAAGGDSTTFATSGSEKNAVVAWFAYIWEAASAPFCTAPVVDRSLAESAVDFVMESPTSVSGEDRDTRSYPHGGSFKRDVKGSQETEKSFTVSGASTSAFGGPGESGQQFATATSIICKDMSPYLPDIQILGNELATEALRIFKLYAGIGRKLSSFQYALKLSKRGISVFTSVVPNSDWNVVKTTSTVGGSLNQLVQLLMSHDRVSEYDENFSSYEFVADIDTAAKVGDVESENIPTANTTTIRRYKYKAVWPVSGRDFIILTTSQRLPDGSVILTSISPPDAVYPATKSHVRAYLMCTGTHIVPNKVGNKCTVTTYGHTNLGGSLPPSIVNSLSVNAPYKAHKAISEIMQKLT
jgi:hypothetical protein